MQAKALLASGLVAALLAGCSDKAAELGAEWGCGPIHGLAQFKGKTPKFVLVGEFIETNEAPAAFAELACHLAARQDENEGPLFVGVSEYLGGATDAETKMRARLEALAAMGASIAIGAIGGEDRPYSVRQRSAIEKEWAKAIEAKVAAAGSSRALLLMPRTDAMAAPIPRKGDRFAGYDPMATFLPEGEVLALEIRTTPQAGVSAPAIRLYPDMADGFHGQIALSSLTRPAVELALATTAGSPTSGVNVSDVRINALLNAPMPREQRIDALADLLQKMMRRGSPETPGDAELMRASRPLATFLVDRSAPAKEPDLARSGVPLFPMDDFPAPN